jgi:two-component system CheB/CheR fusion protein
LQSINEALNALNHELHNRNRELGHLSDDLANLLSSTALPLLMVDNDLRIKRVTPAAERLFNVRPGDVGRPVGDIRLGLSQEDLDPGIRRVIDSLAGEEIEMLDRDGRWHLLRIHPCRSGDNRIEGAVLTMLDIDQLRQARTSADLARSFAEAVVESVQIPLLVLKMDLKIRVANDAFLTAYGLRSADVQDRSLAEIDKARWSMPEFKKALTRLLSEETSSEILECLQDSPGAGKRTVLISSRRVLDRGSRQIVVAIQDITAQRRAEKVMMKEHTRLKRSVRKTADALLESEDALRLSQAELRALSGSLLHAQDEERRRVSRELHDDVSQNVVKLQYDIEALEQTLPGDREKEKQRLLAVRDDAARLSSDLSRIAHALHPATLDCLGLTVALSAYASEFSERTDTPVEFNTAGVPEEIPPEIAGSFYRIAQEALRNIARHSGAAASISLTGEESCLTLAIRDSGPGFDRDAVRGKGGLGLVSMEERARLIHASFTIDTAPAQGVLITVSASLSVAVPSDRLLKNITGSRPRA